MDRRTELLNAWPLFSDIRVRNACFQVFCYLKAFFRKYFQRANGVSPALIGDDKHAANWLNDLKNPAVGLRQTE